MDDYEFVLRFQDVEIDLRSDLNCISRKLSAQWFGQKKIDRKNKLCYHVDRLYSGVPGAASYHYFVITRHVK